jgi:hypothetical protein
VKPERIQLRRTRGWKKPGNTVVVARPSVFGNPYKAYDYGQEKAVSMFRQWIRSAAQKALRERAKEELHGKNLACWCKPGTPCHAEVWLDLVNKQ